MIDVITAVTKQAAAHPVGANVIGLGMMAVTSEAAVEVVTATPTLVDWGQFIAFVAGALAALGSSIAAIINALANYRRKKDGRSEP